MAVRRMMLMLGVMGLAACGAQPEPEDGPRPIGEMQPMVLDMGGGGTPSIRGLIGERQRLRLTGAQVTTLDSLAIRLSAANDSLRRSLSDGWERERPRVGGERWEQARPVLETIAQNNRNAGLLVQSVLDEDQRRIACEIYAEDREEDRRRAPVRPAPRGRYRLGGGGARPSAADSAQAAALRVRGWPWCPPPPTPERRR
jgi:hypothetical protein